FVERVVGLVAETAQDARAAAVAAEQPGIEGERCLLARTYFAGFKPPQRRRELLACARMLGERAAQGTLAVMGKLKQVVVIEPEQRALQRDREREIVLRQQQRI